jgi:hypothetical protein
MTQAASGIDLFIPEVYDHDMADGRWRDHNGYVPEVVK